MNCSSILDSTAEAERLFSTSLIVFRMKYKPSTRVSFKGIAFLRESKGFLDRHLFINAMSQVRSARVQCRLEEDAEQEELL